jgi:HAD superfamily hydrolase (TIGR01549 family)
VANLKVNKDVIPDIKLMIFDKDGTLTELYHYWSQMVGLRAKLICEKFGLDAMHEKNLAYEMGADFEKGRLRPHGPVGLKKREVVLKAAVDYVANMGFRDAYHVCFDVFKEVDEISSLNLGQFLKPIKGAVELIDVATAKGCRIAIATTDRSERAKLATEFLGFSDKIDFIIGADSVSNPKPDPEQIYMTLDTLKIDPLNAVMVGDALTDVQMAVNAGLKASIGVLTGFATLEELKAITHYVVKDVSEIEVLN